MTEVEKLLKRQEDGNYRVKGIFPGENFGEYTDEQVAAELNKVLDQIDAGNTKEIYDMDGGLEFDSHEECRALYKEFPRPNWSVNDPDSRETYLQRVRDQNMVLHMYMTPKTTIKFIWKIWLIV